MTARALVGHVRELSQAIEATVTRHARWRRTGSPLRDGRGRGTGGKTVGVHAREDPVLASAAVLQERARRLNRRWAEEPFGRACHAAPGAFAVVDRAGRRAELGTLPSARPARARQRVGPFAVAEVLHALGVAHARRGEVGGAIREVLSIHRAPTVQEDESRDHQQARSDPIPHAPWVCNLCATNLIYKNKDLRP